MAQDEIDYFYEYLTYCEDEELVSPSEFLARVHPKRDTPLHFGKLTNDLNDTYRAGKLKRIVLDNGTAAYVRKVRSFITK